MMLQLEGRRRDVVDWAGGEGLVVEVAASFSLGLVN
jgi:hypothetical protein